MKHNILIVEDDADITELLTLYLDGSDFHVLSAACLLYTSRCV